MLRIRAGSPQPIYQQIVDGLTRSIATGELKPGDNLPSIRELAAELVVNPNTVVRAFSELERLGMVVAQPGRGFVVIARQRMFTSSEHQRQLALPAQSLVTAALRLGATLDDVQTAVENAWKNPHQDQTGKVRP